MTTVEFMWAVFKATMCAKCFVRLEARVAPTLRVHQTPAGPARLAHIAFDPAVFVDSLDQTMTSVRFESPEPPLRIFSWLRDVYQRAKPPGPECPPPHPQRYA